MRVFQKTLLLFVSGCFVGWSANAQTIARQSGGYLAEIAYSVPASKPLGSPETRTPHSVSLAASSVASASFVLHHQGDAVLLHLKDRRNHVMLQVINAAGQVVQTTTHINLSSGFHELSLDTPPSTLCAFRLIVNQEVSVFSAIR